MISGQSRKTSSRLTALPRLGGVVVALLLTPGCARNERLSVHLADYSVNPPPGRIRIDMASGEAPLYAEPVPPLDGHDFKSATLAQDDLLRQPIIRLCFAPGGQAKFNKIAADNRGRRFVFLIDGKLLFAPIVPSRPEPECAVIDGTLSAEEAKALQRAIG
jgi:preprotein translocase subunit SecD